MNNQLEIVERSSGYWIVNDAGVVAGPYGSYAMAEAMLKRKEKSKRYIAECARKKG